MKLMGRNEGRPVWIYLLGAGYAFWASRDYTPAEQEYSTYTSIINGGSGIFYFASHPKSISQWKRIKRLLSELTELTPVIGSHENAPAIKCAAPSIEFLVKKSENAIYLIAVNSSKQPVNARFDLSSCNLPAGASSEVLFEKRSSEIKDNILNDRFDGFQRHVYRIPVK
jgi:hypothetical protein